ncbi:LysR family transcriptional regulator [Megasphaera vaginalis (ex Bordigoni et al. 2020)]|uniref:LysR family transcriptional regulator n=1 Tax=Megasphaera vaginalis (ex Bordigoni et al. 2020) TaxID=2045301 RepID=UPI000C7B7F60|nr:LysR family transcriptional regulator [Megasphaera vaginalis (ex Bordigoni et al. 2020)]
MTLQQLKYIIEISKCGSISAAANKLFIAQPSLSKVVKDLEEEFQIKILRRNRHGIAFTPEGTKFLHFANHVLEASNTMRDYFAKERAMPEALHLSISSQHYLFAVDGLISFILNLPDTARYTLRIHEVRTSQVIQDVLVQRSQIGILYVSDMTEQFMHRTFTKNGLEFVPFFDFPPHAYISSRHPLSSQKELTIEQLLPYPYIRYEQGSDPAQLSEEVVIPKVYSQKTIYVTDRSTMLSIIANTDAYNLGTGCLLPRIVGPDVISVPIKGPVGTMKIGWVKRKNAAMSPEMTKYIAYLQDSLNKVMSKSDYVS